MITIQLGKDGTFDTAAATVDGHFYRSRSRVSAVCDVARLLVAGGVPDGPWEAYAITGTLSLVGRSIHRMAELTIKDSGGRLRWVKWQPFSGPGKPVEAC